MTSGVRVTRRLEIPAGEVRFRFTPSGGPGGQHANRSSTRVELIWNVDASRVLGPRQRARLRRRLRNRLDADGNLRVVADERRSQARNRSEAVDRLARLVREALAVPRRRLPTAPTRAARERRLAEKSRRGELKRRRRTPRLEQ